MLALTKRGVAGVTGVAAGSNFLKLLGNIVVTPCVVSAYTRCNTAAKCNSRKAQRFLEATLLLLGYNIVNRRGFQPQGKGRGGKNG